MPDKPTCPICKTTYLYTVRVNGERVKKCPKCEPGYFILQS